MKDEKETKAKLLLSAKAEFAEKGYMQASLRNICRNAGVTTGALYFFFQDKEDLFASLVEEPLKELLGIVKKHYMEEEQQDDLTSLTNLAGTGDDLNVAREVIHCLYQYQDVFLMLLTKSQGSRFENCVEQIVEFSEKHYRTLADRTAEQMSVPRLDDYMIHWMSHMQADVFVHMLSHEKSEKNALEHMERLVNFMIHGWFSMFQK